MNSVCLTYCNEGEVGMQYILLLVSGTLVIVSTTDKSSMCCMPTSS